jgi:tetratricopeptide (TPR) repeat protein
MTRHAIVSITIVAALAGVFLWRNVRRERPTMTRATLRAAPGAAITTRDGLERRIAEMETHLTSQPDDVAAAVVLADALLRQTRVAGNPGLAKRAEQVLAQALREDPGNYDARRMLGSLYLSQHRFREAIAAGERNREARPLDPINYGVIGDAHLELGDYDQAFDAFDRMMRLRPGAAAYARVAYARELQGDLTGALESMKLAADATAANDPEALAWYRSQVGELHLQLGQIDEAKGAFAAASQAFPGHPFAVMGYARAIDVEGDRTGALTLLGELAARTPTPDLYARIGDLLESGGRREEAGNAYAMAEAAWRSDAPEPKNLARFLAERGAKVDEAVGIAERASAERDDIFTNDALAWAYFKANRIGDARRAIARALRTGAKDRAILAHAEAIAAQR